MTETSSTLEAQRFGVRAAGRAWGAASWWLAERGADLHRWAVCLVREAPARARRLAMTASETGTRLAALDQAIDVARTESQASGSGDVIAPRCGERGRHWVSG